METEITIPCPCPDPVSNSIQNPNSKPKIVVIMGATGAGKSKLAIDLAAHFPIEIINADSMQVYQGLDVLTNKVPVHEQKGVPHHLLGTISPNVEFTAKDFRDSAIKLIDEIWSRNCLPVIVGGTNYYIQALVSRFLLDDHAEDLEENSLLDITGDNEKPEFELESENCQYTYSHLTELDPVAANRIHPNDQRKIKQYLSLYLRSGVLPSKLFQGNTMQNWGQADNLRYDCCFICVDSSLPALDQYVDQRVDLMVATGLLEEVREIYKYNADYTRGLRQAIGVREFEDFLRYWNSEGQQSLACPELFKENMRQIMDSSAEDQPKLMLKEAIEKVKLNTRRLVRRQKRRINRLQMLFGWSIHFIDVTSCLPCSSVNLWTVNVVEPSVNIIKSFLEKTPSSESTKRGCEDLKLAQRDLWTQYVCQACGNKELRGAHEWEQHKQGRSHRKRVSRLRKSGLFPDFTQNAT
ncbi:tRNA delta(2)-isopentenylpyrophosphate transferase [Handroanthus impetiginosus]|uniref:tRNA delta(2)-isopentenylpyrophosphate transferase n=1 Tax=Handroanthus impetiginosus TaxID=429701 RepID=A0A2G9I6Y0_9LAMI|nr:tRNA delta(2)-isopentenylpyrophosphate transferase [Handroanthus impetiginosus]